MKPANLINQSNAQSKYCYSDQQLPIVIGNYNADQIELYTLDYNSYYDAFAAGGQSDSRPLLMLYTRGAPFQRVVWHSEFKIGVAIRGSLATDVNADTFYFYAFVNINGEIIASTRIRSFITPNIRKQFISTTSGGYMIVATRDANNRGSVACLTPDLKNIHWQKKFQDGSTWVTAVLSSTGSIILAGRAHDTIGTWTYNKLIISRVHENTGDKLNSVQLPLNLGSISNEVIIAKMRIRSNLMVGCLMNERLMDPSNLQVGYIAYDFNLDKVGAFLFQQIGANALFFVGFLNTFDNIQRSGSFFNLQDPFVQNYHIVPKTVAPIIILNMNSLIYDFDYVEAQEIIVSTDVVLIPAWLNIENNLQNSKQQLWPGTTSNHLTSEISYTFNQLVQPRVTCYVNYPCTANLGTFTINNCLETNTTYTIKISTNNSVVNAINAIYQTDMSLIHPYGNIPFSYTPSTALDITTLFVQVDIGYLYQTILRKFQSFSFELEIKQFCEENYQILTMPTIQNLTYQLGQISSQFLIGNLTWQYQLTDCPFTVNMSAEQDSPIATFNSIQKKFQVSTNDSAYVGLNKVKIIWTLKMNYGLEFNETIDWYVNVLALLDEYSIKNTAPKFASELKDQEVKAGESLTVYLPQVTDLENDNFVIVLDAGDAIIFSTIKNSKIEFNPDIGSLDKQYKINVIIQDINQAPLQSKYSFTLKDWDVLYIQFKLNFMYTNVIRQSIIPEDYEINKIIPPQMSQGLLALLSSVGGTSSVSMQSLMGSNLIINLLISKIFQESGDLKVIYKNHYFLQYQLDFLLNHIWSYLQDPQ
eukprot:403334911